jgi:hypothetical protein
LIVHIARSKRISIAFVVAALLTAGSYESALAAPRACRVKNVTQDTWFATDSGAALTRAIALAKPGARLNVFGTCVGSFILDKDLTIAGTRSLTAPTTLSGGGVGRVLEVDFADVTLIDLTVTHGSSGVGGGGGLAVFEGSSATLRRVKVVANENTVSAGGIVNGGDLRLYNSRVSRNDSGIDGGGIFNYGELLLENVTVYGNEAVGVGGGIFSEGVTTINRSRIRFNVASSGGGITSVNTLTVTDSVISDNIPDDCVC